ncbi:Cloroperoxidase [Schizopora paradoxa]|uniref:Cloroperoxidase n=1 Tax=Schizopora paradoxa TaxID=27342 RepID=A0A0H2RTM8_9AGAM|nr:Cloroperoxidase [Schizopora paradoxa]
MIDIIPYLLQGVQLFTLTLIYTVLHSWPLGSVKTAGRSGQSNQTNGHDKKAHSPCPFSKRSELYPYIAPTETDDRAPCPALNTLANHGFIPRTGRGITATNLMFGLREAYRVSLPLAAFLAYGGIVLLGQVVGFGSDPDRDGVGFSLKDLARHDRIEHDASITHPNIPAGDEYAPTKQDPALFDTFIKDARPASGPLNKGELSYGPEDIARARVRREAQPGTRIDAVHQEVARGEIALVFSIFGFLTSGGNAKTDKPPKEVLGGAYRFPISVVETWWKEERLPTPDWVPARETTLLGTIAQSGLIRKEMQKLRASAKIA